MKHILFLLLLLLSSNVYTQTLCAKIDTIEGIIVSKYKKNRIGFYCEMPTLLLCKGDSIVFFQNSTLNSIFLESYPSLEKTIGNSVDYEYDFLLEYTKGIYSHDLTVSIFNFHTEEFGNKVVKSKSFYYKNDDEDLYSVYQFTGTVVLYKGSVTFEEENHYDCFCSQAIGTISNFAVLKEAFLLKPLSDDQVKYFKLEKSGIVSIVVYYCE